MATARFSGFVTAALSAVLFAYVIGLGQAPRFTGVLTAAQYEACGLDKLTPDEVDLLFGLLCVPRSDFLATTAFERMEKDGWKPVELIGYGVRAEDTAWPEKFLMFARSGELRRFKLPMGEDDLDPGRYWAQADSHVWTLMRPDGSTENLWPLDD